MAPRPPATSSVGEVVSSLLQVRPRLPDQADEFRSQTHDRSSVTDVKPRRLCLITPGHISTNPRLAKEADALAATGYEVHVLACDYLGWAREADGEFGRRAWRIAAPVRFGPLAPGPLRLKQRLRLRVARGLVRLGLSAEGLVNAAWHPAAPELAKAAAEIEADLYVAHYPAALPAAARAARKHGGRYAFDAEDFHLGDPPERVEFDDQRRLTRAIEGHYLPGAAYVTAASPDIADAYVDSYGLARPAVLLNVCARAEAPPAPSARGSASPGPSLYWFSQTVGSNRGLECAVRAIAHARSRPHLYLRGHFAAGYQGHINDLARSLSCSERLHYLDPAWPSQMVRLAAQYDLGLASETGHTLARSCALTNKLFTYLLAGVPTLVSDTTAQGRFAAGKEECFRLYPSNDPRALAAALDEILLDFDRLSRARAAAFDLGQSRYNWEVESRSFLELVERTLSSGEGDRPQRSDSCASRLQPIPNCPCPRSITAASNGSSTCWREGWKAAAMR